MKPSELNMEFLVIDQEEISLSSQALAVLMQATMAKGASLRLQVKGFSMLPFIRDSDVVTISPLPGSSIGLGWVVAFINPKLVIHRIIGKRNGLYFIKGDNALDAGGLILKEKILGCVTKIERNGKNIFLALNGERLIIALLSRIRVWYSVLLLWRLFPLSIRNAIKSII